MNLNMLFKKYIQFIKFSLVGVSNTLVSFILYYILVKLHLYYIAANVISYSAGVVNSYILNSNWVFKNKHSNNKLSKFIAVNLGALLLSTILLYIFVDYFSLNKILSQAAVTLIVLFVNYTANKLWTFK